MRWAISFLLERGRYAEGSMDKALRALAHFAEELCRFDAHMSRARGMAEGTRHGRLRIVERLLLSKFAGKPLFMSSLQPEDMRPFIVEQLQTLRWGARCRRLLSRAQATGNLPFRAGMSALWRPCARTATLALMWYCTGTYLTSFMSASMFARPAPPLRLHVGVDGGGSRTRARVQSPQGQTVGFAEAGASGLALGIDAAWTQVHHAVCCALQQAGHDAADWRAVGMGLGVAGAHSPALLHAFLAAAPPVGALTVSRDTHTALLGAHAGGPGAVVIAGTGSAGEALHADGRSVLAGGWGFPAGDEGSGGWLGLRAMAETQRASDGRAVRGALATAVCQATGGSAAAMGDWLRRATQTDFASLAPLVFDTANDDLASRLLLDGAAQALAEHARALDAAGTLPLAMLGSVARRLVPWLPADLRAREVEPAGDAMDGALRLLRGTLAGVGP